MRSPKQKGNDLEQAVRLIEDTVLRDSPGYRKGTFRLQSNLIITKDGVRHEIDIHVTATIAPGYESTFIFECKNWEAKVGKNELIAFSEKVAITGAQRGFFVAKAFTKDAQAQAKKDARVRLLKASQYEPVSRVVFPQFHLMNIYATHGNALISGFGENGNRREIPLVGRTLLIRGEKLAADEYVKRAVERARDAHLNQTLPQQFGEGCHEVTFSSAVAFEDGEASLDTRPIQSITIDGRASIEVAVASVTSIFDVQSRGRLVVVCAGDVPKHVERGRMTAPHS